MRNIRQTLTKEFLEKEYLESGKSVTRLAREIGIGVNTLRRRLHDFGLPVIAERQFGGRRNTGRYPQLRDRAWLAEELKTKTMLQIAGEIGTSSGNISDYARRYGLREPEGVKAGLAKSYPEGRFGEDASRWRGGKIMTGGGHIYRYAPDHPKANLNGYVMEHRLILEESLGRELRWDEVVHHKNGIKTDNRAENLEVMSVTDHRKIHMNALPKLYTCEQRCDQLSARIVHLEGVLDAHGITY
jgi:hypothetical protein